MASNWLPVEVSADRIAVDQPAALAISPLAKGNAPYLACRNEFVGGTPRNPEKGSQSAEIDEFGGEFRRDRFGGYRADRSSRCVHERGRSWISATVRRLPRRFSKYTDAGSENYGPKWRRFFSPRRF
ncbi:MAG: hypothetical protein QOE68_363 [Thermoanaerobaculia bacterium]|nr:hypothetical protein [Thermoanaerobaculia bacterium]